MDLNLSAAELQFRDELRQWLRSHLPAPWTEPLHGDDIRTRYWEYLRNWQRALFDGGWTGISWPREFGGRGATPIEQSIFQEELALADAPRQIGIIGEGLVGPTIIAVGTDDQKSRLLRGMLCGDHVWCQGFSEPGSGSDLASLSTRAVLEGDQFIVNGQKVWTSFAHLAEWCMLMVRTDPGASKHRGLTCLLVDMKSEGVSVRPLRQMSGDRGFNEVFFTDVRVPVANVLGKVDDGWRTAITALMNERANLGSGLHVMFKRNLDALINRCKTIVRDGVSVADDPVARQKIAQAIVELEIFRLNTKRSLSRAAKTGTAGAEGSILKLYWSEMNQRLSRTAMEALGIFGQMDESDDGMWVYNYLRSRGNTIEAGTSEIQRNVIAERVLGLPKSY
jgi:alkylation response protein AidB-like acyl-CoA dehydrogenase